LFGLYWVITYKEKNIHIDVKCFLFGIDWAIRYKEKHGGAINMEH